MLAIGVGCAVLFAWIGTQAHAAGPIWFDVPVGSFVQGLHVSTALWQGISALGGPLLIAIDVLVVLILLARREFLLAAVFAGTLIAVTIGIDLAKDLVVRPRPADPLVHATGYSYPSGHACSSIVSYGLLAMIALRSDLSPRIRRWLVFGVVVLVALIGCSRVALGVHYPTDVVGGWLGGAAVLCGVTGVMLVWSARGRDRQADLPAIAGVRPSGPAT